MSTVFSYLTRKDFMLSEACVPAFDPIGISCRICERQNCAQRAVPPLKRRLVVDHNARGPVPYRLD